MILTERHIIKQSNSLYNELDNLCFLSKNLYNSALYTVRQFYFTNKKYFNWIKINNQFVSEKQQDYYALPCKVSQQTLKMVDQNMKSFFNAIKAKNSKPKLPKYLDKIKGRFVVTYTNQAISKKALQNGYIELSKTNIKLKTNVKNVKQVRIVPRNNFIVVEILYEVRSKLHNNLKETYCGIDFGLNNLITCSFQNDSPLIISGILITIIKIISLGLKETIYSILSGLLIFIIVYLLMLLGNFLFKKESLGGGDIKLSFIAGLTLGPILGVFYIILASFLAFPYAMYISVKGEKGMLPFGPFLVTSMLLLYFNSDLANIFINALLGL